MKGRSEWQDNFINDLIDKMDTVFTSPEEKILKQGQYGNDLYYISSGDCVVNQITDTGKKLVALKLLTEGDHFGEIGMIYGCKRTVSIVCRNYNTMARLSYSKYRAFINEYPVFKTYI